MAIVDRSYVTPSWGRIKRFEGHEVEGAAPSRILRVGHGPKGSAEFISANGYIERVEETKVGTEAFEARLKEEEERAELRARGYYGYYR